MYNSIVGGWADSWLTLNNWRFGKLEVPSEEFSIIIRLKWCLIMGLGVQQGKHGARLVESVSNINLQVQYIIALVK